MVVSYGGGEDSLNQGQWRRCAKCQGMFWIGHFPDSGICPADQLAHQPVDQINYVFRHDQPEDANHQSNWRRCRKCYGLFWDGLWMKALPPLQACAAGGAHDAEAGEDIPSFLQDELILEYNVGDDSTHQGNWRFCTKCFGLFFDADQNFKGTCPADQQGHVHVNGQPLPPPPRDSPVHIQPPVDFNFVLPHDVAADSWHEVGWRYCTKCALLFRGQHFMHMPDVIFIDNGHCPAGGNHVPAGYIFVLPHRLQEDPQNDRDWRFCTKCFAMVSTKASGKFWTVASSVVRNSDFPGLPASESGDGLVILGYGFSDFYLAWIPLGGAGPRLRDTL
jgi:hypothetical protein